VTQRGDQPLAELAALADRIVAGRVVDVVIGDIAPPRAPAAVMAITGRHQAD
jgi:hypothetical protein